MYIVHWFPFWVIQVHVMLLEQRTRTHVHPCIPPPTAQTTLDTCIQNFSKIIFTSYEEWGWENCQHCRARVATATHTMLQFYPTKITSSSAASGRPLKRKWPIRENTQDDLRKCFTNNTTSKSAGKKKSYNTDKLPTNQGSLVCSYPDPGILVGKDQRS